MTKPTHPVLGAWPNGQWAKKINTKPYYFGSWKSDPKGEAAIREYNERLPGILAGTDHLRHLEAKGGELSVGGLFTKFSTQRRIDTKAGSLSPATFGGYISAITDFIEFIGGEVAVSALKPEHFAGYATRLVEQGLKSRARKNAFAYIKAMFRWGSGNGHCPLPNFGTAFKAPKTTKGAIRQEKARAGVVDYSARIATGAEIDSLLSVMQPNLRAITLLGINCGLGPADIGRLRWRHIDLEKGRLNYPRHKTGNLRAGYLWKRTREALLAARNTKHGKAAWLKDGADALVFITKDRQPYYRETEKVEDGKVVGVVIHNAISITFGRAVKKFPAMKGLSFYRLRHTFKTLGKRAKDRDALNLCMGHGTAVVGSSEGDYDHEMEIEIPWKRVRRVSLKVKARLWPKPKQAGGTAGQTMRIVGDGDGEAEAA